jgi:iron complex outermembrane receptor protein
MNVPKKRLLLGVACIATLHSAAYAQVPTDATGQTADVGVQGVAQPGGESEVIIVTAQRNESRLERTPVAVTVVSEETLAQANITTQNDLRTVAPGLTIRSGQSSNQINYSIRGQSLDAYSNTRPGVLPYVNEVQVPSRGSSSGFFDLQSVQVLKGPQGTLFGRNATGGAVLFTTQRPTEELGGYLSVLAGNFDQRKAEGAINVPLSGDELLVRVAGVYQEGRGYQFNEFTGRHLGDLERFGIRGTLAAKLGDSLENDLIVEHQDSDGTNVNGVINAIEPAIAGVPIPFLYSPANPGFAGYVAANPRVDSRGLANFLAEQQARGPYRARLNIPAEYVTKTTNVTNITTLDLGGNAQLKNIFGYAKFTELTNSGADGTSYGISDQSTSPRPFTGNEVRGRQYSNELNLSGTAFGNQLKYVTGLYYADETANYFVNSNFLDIFGGIPVISDYTNLSETYAAYAQGTLSLAQITGMEGLSITAGLRYTKEKVGLLIENRDPRVIGNPAGAPAGQDFSQSRNIDNLSWTFGLENQINPNLFAYAVTRRSYKNGGYNGASVPLVGFSDEIPNGGNAYRDEKITDVEAGVKFAGFVGTMPARLNLAAYYSWVDNSQRAAFIIAGGGPVVATVNVPKAEVYGFELDGQIDPVDWLQIGGSAVYTSARFTNPNAVIAGAPAVLGTYPDTPKWIGNLFAEVNAPVGRGLTGLLRGEVYGQTKSFYSSSANVNTSAVLPGYVLANFRVGIEDETAGWSLTANLKNAFDRTHYIGGIALGQLTGINTIIPGQPRTFTVEARLNF